MESKQQLRVTAKTRPKNMLKSWHWQYCSGHSTVCRMCQ